MNRWAKSFNMNNTNYANPHGLSNKFNFSSAYDIAKLEFNVLSNDIV